MSFRSKRGRLRSSQVGALHVFKGSEVTDEIQSASHPGAVMDQQTITLIAAVVAAVVAIASLLLNSSLTQSREKRLVVWRKEVDRLIELEELAGAACRVVEDLGSYREIDIMRERLATQLEQLEAMAGRFARFPKVRQAVRDLHNALSCLFADRRDHKDDRESRKHVEPAFTALLDACMIELGR